MSELTPTLKRVIDLAQASGKKKSELAIMAGTTEQWIGLLLKGKISRPNLVSIEELYRGLTGKNLICD